MLFLNPMTLISSLSCEDDNSINVKGNWYIVASSKELLNKPISKIRFGERLVFWRKQCGEAVCMLDRCPHRGTALSLGKLENGCISCPYHGFRFNAAGVCDHVSTDTVTSCTALRVKTYPVREANGWVWMWRGPSMGILPEPPTSDEVIGYNAHSEIQISWPVHFTRAMEALIDLSHVPTVHPKTLARVTHRGPFDNITVEKQERGFKAYNHEDPTGNYFLVKYPNLWLNWCAPDVFNVQAPVPVGSCNTIIYSRTYFKNRFAPLGPLLKLAYSLGSRYILRQDKRVVETQRPKNVDDVDGEHLMPSDKPIIAYRQLRKSLSPHA